MMVLHPSLHHEYEIKCFFSLSSRLASKMKTSKVGNQTNSHDPRAVNSRVFRSNLNIFRHSKYSMMRIFHFLLCARNHCKKTMFTLKKIYYNTVTCHRVKWNTYVAHSLYNLQYADHDILLETLKNMYKLNGCTAVLYAAEMKHTILKCERLRMKHVCQTRDTSSYLIMSMSGSHRTL